MCRSALFAGQPQPKPDQGTFAKIGVRPGALGATGYTDLIRSELVRWKEVIRAGNIRAD
jgi:hypothetical protein